MEFIDKLEKNIQIGLSKLNLPTLPSNVKKIIVDNLWWVVLIFTVLVAVSTLVAFMGVLVGFIAFVVTAGFALFIGPLTGWGMVSGFLAVVIGFVQTFLFVVAIKPLQDKDRKGWKLLFISVLLASFSIIIKLIINTLSFNYYGIIGDFVVGALWIALAVYLLFDIKTEFHIAKKARTARPAKIVKKD